MHPSANLPSLLQLFAAPADAMDDSSPPAAAAGASLDTGLSTAASPATAAAALAAFPHLVDPPDPPPPPATVKRKLDTSSATPPAATPLAGLPLMPALPPPAALVHPPAMLPAAAAASAAAAATDSDKPSSKRIRATPAATAAPPSAAAPGALPPDLAQLLASLPMVPTLPLPPLPLPLPLPLPMPPSAAAAVLPNTATATSLPKAAAIPKAAAAPAMPKPAAAASAAGGGDLTKFNSWLAQSSARATFSPEMHGAKKKEQQRVSTTGTKHESEHSMGYEPAARTGDPTRPSGALERGESARARMLEKLMAAYQESKIMHRRHIGTGTDSEPDGSGFNSESYRAAQRALLESGNVSAVIQINQLGYAHMGASKDKVGESLPSFAAEHATAATRADAVKADDSYENMVKHMNGMPYADGPANAAAPVTGRDRVEMLLARGAARTGKWPTKADITAAYAKLGVKNPCGEGDG